VKPIIPFNQPYMSCGEIANITHAYQNGITSGTGPFTIQCETWLEREVNVTKALLTHSCSGALDMAALLIELQPGDEVIMPSYNFVSTANSIALRGAVPVFIDIRSDTLNIDETLIEAAITPKTRAICVVHYAGISCEMDTILAIAMSHNLYVIEDAAHAIGASYKGQMLGGIGDLGAFSFHETKNISCGHGGALLLRGTSFIEHAEWIHQKGTNRNAFIRNEVDKYTWQTIGSSFALGDLSASILAAQLDEYETIATSRMLIWNQYNDALQTAESHGYIQRPIIPDGCQHNAHIYYVLLSPRYDRTLILEQLQAAGIYAVFHYVPLHKSLAGQRIGRIHGNLDVTDDCSGRIIRLPLWHGLNSEQTQYIIDKFHAILLDESCP